MVDARAERGGVVQLTAGKDLTLSSGSQVLADSSADGGWVPMGRHSLRVRPRAGWTCNRRAVVSAQGDDAADGRIVIRAKCKPMWITWARADANRIKVRKIGAALKAADIQVEGCKPIAPKPVPTPTRKRW